MSRLIYGVLGIFFPVVGIVLYLVWRDTKPQDARAAGIGALINILWTVFVLLLFIGGHLVYYYQ